MKKRDNILKRCKEMEDTLTLHKREKPIIVGLMDCAIRVSKDDEILKIAYGEPLDNVEKDAKV